MILGSSAAVAAGGWQYWQMKTLPPSVFSPTYQYAPPVANPANMQPYVSTNALGAPAVPTVGVPANYSPYRPTNNAGAATNGTYPGTPYQPAPGP